MLFFLIQKIGLFDRLEGVVLSITTIALPFAVWMMKNYFETIPPELEEAATIDGCSRFQAFYLIILPLARPGIAATAVFDPTGVLAKILSCAIPGLDLLNILIITKGIIYLPSDCMLVMIRKTF